MHNYIATHRCDGSLQNYMSIRYLQKNWMPTQEGWYLLEPKENYDWMTWYNQPICPIKYCPFCGELLEEPKNNS